MEALLREFLEPAVGQVLCARDPAPFRTLVRPSSAIPTFQVIPVSARSVFARNRFRPHSCSSHKGLHMS